MFSTQTLTPNVYNDGYYYAFTCQVCGAEWADNHNGKDTCTNVAAIKEWDGTISYVHTDVGDETVDVVYQDGVKHTVSRPYFKSVFLHWAR